MATLRLPIANDDSDPSRDGQAGLQEAQEALAEARASDEIRAAMKGFFAHLDDLRTVVMREATQRLVAVEAVDVLRAVLPLAEKRAMDMLAAEGDLAECPPSEETRSALDAVKTAKSLLHSLAV